VTVAIDAYVPDDDLRICFGCGAVKPFKQFIHVGTKQKPRPDFTPTYAKFIKRLFGIKHPEPGPYPTDIYPYLSKKNDPQISLHVSSLANGATPIDLMESRPNSIRAS
jgi:hypothetical protein